MNPNDPRHRPDPDSPAYIRLNAGMYALSKLAGAGFAFLVLSLLTLPLWGTVPDPGWLADPARGVYAYALPFSIAADALLALLPRRDRTPGTEAAVHAAAGILAGVWLASDQGANFSGSALAGIAVLLTLQLGRRAGERVPFFLPVFALFLPLLDLLLR
ncbi:hypothetical protein F4V43_14235 [Paenibacillus spiritus]|uniref:Uncharacterized protein n=1 Tax=Paenibacillus spiritus TaxID=2496557 RepID=A0A5J5G2R9_9BACL|nr:hypothetical protein [Paenibacillus spiritus]KAA9001001.1 hypothetical protein F4V43_14235 [Paenibacillus spiritus]